MAVEDMLIVAVLSAGALALGVFVFGQVRGSTAVWARGGIWLAGVLLVLTGVAASACRFAGVL